jgi:hypothetical protein
MPITWAVTLLYMRATTGGTFRAFSSLAEILDIINQGMERLGPAKDAKSVRSEPDRELLIKELCDFNDLPYPIDAATTFDYLHRLGFVVPEQSGKKVEYSLAQELPSPEEVLSFPPDWEDRVDKFLTTGSVLFSYLSLEEIVAD